MYSNFTFKMVSLMSTVDCTFGIASASFNSSKKLFQSTGRSKFRFRRTIFIILLCLIFNLAQTFKLWKLEGGQNNPYFYSAYAFSCALILVFGILLSFYFNEEDIVTGANHTFHIFIVSN